MILAIRTDKPEAEIGLYFDSGQKRQYQKWQAHKQLAETIHDKINAILEAEGTNWNKINGIVCYVGPGSFTGLRIGISVANSLAYSLGVPIVSSTSANWVKNGLVQIKNGEDQKIVIPNYGKQPHITQPKR